MSVSVLYIRVMSKTRFIHLSLLYRARTGDFLGEIFGVVLYGRTIGMIRLYLRFRYYCIEYQSVDINNIP